MNCSKHKDQAVGILDETAECYWCVVAGRDAAQSRLEQETTHLQRVLDCAVEKDGRLLILNLRLKKLRDLLQKALPYVAYSGGFNTDRSALEAEIRKVLENDTMPG